MEEGTTQFTNLLTGEEIAKVLHVSRAYAYQLMRQRIIPTVKIGRSVRAVSYTHLRAHETPEHLVCRLLLEKKNNSQY